MLVRLVAIVFILCFYLNLSHETEIQSKIIPLTLDFTKMINSPSKLSFHVCWDRKNTLKLLKKISLKHHVTILKLDQIKGVPQHHLFILDLNCTDTLEILQKAEELQLFKHPYRWLLLGSTTLDLTNFYFGVGSTVYLIQEIQDNYEVKSVYKLSPNSTNLVEHSLALWSLDEKFLYKNMYTANNRTDLQGTVIRVSYVLTHLDSLNHLWDFRDTNVDALSKANYLLSYNLLMFLNATPEFIMRRTWGYYNPSGIYEGMMGDMQAGNAELAGTALIYTIDRMQHVDYLGAPTPANIKFIFKAPPLSYVTNIFTLPFDTTIWHYSFIMVAIIPICIYGIVLWEWKDPVFKKIIVSEHNAIKPNFVDVIMLNIGAITQQGSDVEPKTISGRIATVFTFLTLMFMYTSYSANIVALLQSTTENIKTLEDLLNSRIELGVEDLPYNHYYFENAQEPVRKAIYEKKIAPKGQKPQFLNSSEGMKKVRDGFYGFHLELTTGYKIISDTFHEHEKCTLKEIEFVHLCEPSIASRKNGEYKEVMKIGLRKLREGGIYNRDMMKIYTTKPACHGKGLHFDSVGLIDCYPAFLFFGVGAAVAIKCLIFEFLIKRYGLFEYFNCSCLEVDTNITANNEESIH